MGCSECGKPIHCKGLCQAHYRKMMRRERGLRKPGRKPDPMKPRSRYAPPKERMLKTHCLRGHEFTEENTWLRIDGARCCRACARERMRAHRPTAKYGLTPERFQALLDEQDNKCAICYRYFSKTLPYQVDHDHACCPGEYTCGDCVRNLLCRDCNLSLGRFQDSIPILESAIEYLVKHKDK